MTIVDQTQLTPSYFGYDKAALSAPSLVGELLVMHNAAFLQKVDQVEDLVDYARLTGLE